jgi:hypothetical protein
MAAAWTDSGTTYTAIKMNVQDTASAAGSLLMDLQVGGVSKFKVSKGGDLTLGGSTGPLVISTQTSGPQAYFYSTVSEGFGLYGNVGFGRSVRLDSTVALAWNSAGPSSGADVGLWRDAANTLAQRNGVNAQTLRVYNTFTDASNYERGFVRWATNVLEIGTEAAGTGVSRALALRSATLSINLDGNGLAWNTSGRGIGMGTAVSGSYNVITSAGGVNLWHATSDSVAIREVAGFTNGAKLDFLTTGNALMARFTSQDSAVLRLSGPTNGAAHELVEMTAPAAPAADRVRIYAEDNGSGKTRLMVRFATGAAVQIAIEP